MIYLNDDIASLDLSAALRRVGPQRAAHALRYRQERDRRLALAVYLLLMDGLEKEYGIVEPQEFLFHAHGKPSLKSYPDIHFNLSHCPRAALCVIGEQPVGADVECVAERLDMELCHYCMNKHEMAQILEAGSPPLAFARFWTRKEAFMKLTGQGLVDDLPALMQSPLAARVSFQTVDVVEKGYVYSVCRRSDGAVDLMI